MASENLKKVVLIITKMVTTGESAFKDGFQWPDVFSFIPELTQIPEIIKQKDALAAELKALNPVTLRELASFIEASLVLENKKTEDVIEAAIEVLAAVFNLISKVKPVPPPVAKAKSKAKHS